MKLPDTEWTGAIEEPKDYFRGRGHVPALPSPTDILLFVRRERSRLQQEALQNRSHHRWVLILNLRTPGQVHVDHRTHSLRPGEALLVMPYQFHHFTHLHSRKLLWLFCTFELGPAPLLETLRHQVVSLGPEAEQTLRRLLESWRAAGAPASDPAPGLLLQTTVLTLLLELRRRAGCRPPGESPPPGTRLLETVNRLLDARGTRTLSIAALAERLGMSESSLRTRFRSEAGVPLGEYLRNFRINRAMALLRNSDLPVAEVACETGFASPQAFSRAFRKATGRTPRDYRKS